MKKKKRKLKIIKQRKENLYRSFSTKKKKKTKKIFRNPGSQEIDLENLKKPIDVKKIKKAEEEEEKEIDVLS